MIRDGRKTYIDGETRERLPKINDDEYEKQVKWELNRTHDNIIRVMKNPLGKNCTLLPSQKELLSILEKDNQFWKEEMSHFDKNPSHKRLKPKRIKMSEDKLYETVIRIINNEIQEGRYCVSKENIAIQLHIRKSDLDKTFMRLNREGLLSQAKHKFMHDSNRSAAPMYSNEYTVRSDWATNVYYIRTKSEPEEALEEDELERNT